MLTNILKYDHIIWDWNGTLLNDVELCASIMNNLLRKESLPEISLKKYREIFTFPVEEYYKLAGHNFEKNSFEILGREFMVEYEDNKLDCALYPFVKESMQLLKEKGKKQYLLSAYKHDNLEGIIKSFKIDQYFEHIAGLDNIYAGSKLELGKEMINKINPNGIDENILLIGDTTHDLEVARGIGIDCLLISSGHQNKERLLKLGIPVMNNIAEFKEALIKEGNIN
ncbi:MAG: HAD family hydrolase [Ignavibacteriae bacterium]|nr:MAG: HAD family hydrolase [Ignavibacteriota bacterium]